MNGQVVHTCCLHLLALMAFSTTELNAGQTRGYQQESISRQRLVTDSELISYLDSSFAPHNTSTQEIILRYISHLQTRTTPRYYFGLSEMTERINYFVSKYPDTVRAMERDAAEFIERFGFDVDWNGNGHDRKGVRHTPNTVRALARQRYAESIVLQYFFRKDETAVAFWLNHVRDFADDVVAGRVEKGGNDIFERFYAGHRLRNWLAVHHLLSGEKIYSAEDRLFVLKTLILNAANIFDQCRTFSYGNHQLVGAEALYEATLMFPEFSFMREWNAQAKKIVLEHAEKEITESGFQLERSSHYHKLDIVNYLRFYMLARRNDDPLPDSFTSRFKSMFTAMIAVAAPNRKIPFLQDVSDSAYARFDDIANEMSAGAVLFDDPQFKFFGREKFPADYFWFFSLGEVERYSSIPAMAPAANSVRLAGCDYIVMRDGWNAGSQYLLIDGGYAAKKPDHTHGGVLGIMAFSGGELFLPNYPVRYSEPRYRILKNSYAKNVALVDSLPQGTKWIGNAANTGFGKWGLLPSPTIRSWITDSLFDYFSGTHDGFNARGVRYERSVLYVKKKYWIVIDDFRSNSGTHTYQQLWQGKYHMNAGTHHVAQRIGDSELLIVQADKDLKSRNTTVGDLYPSIWFEAKSKVNHRFVTLLYPRSAGDKTVPSIFLAEREGRESIDVRYATQTDRIQIHNNTVHISTHSIVN